MTHGQVCFLCVIRRMGAVKLNLNSIDIWYKEQLVVFNKEDSNLNVFVFNEGQ